MRPIEEVMEQFRKKGRKVTSQRRVVVELLEGDNTHPTAEEIYQRALKVLPEISRTTVYNTLRELVEMGELSLVEDLSEKGIRYDTMLESHHHLFCICCHTLFDIPGDIKNLELPSTEHSGFEILNSQVTFYGFCPQCRAHKGGRACSDARKK